MSFFVETKKTKTKIIEDKVGEGSHYDSDSDSSDDSDNESDNNESEMPSNKSDNNESEKPSKLKVD